MLKEDLSIFIDGAQTDEKDVATVISSLDNTVIFEDDAGSVFFLIADAAAFECGTVAPKKSLSPITDADPSLREKIYAALGREEQ